MHQDLFSDRPPFTFNVAFASAAIDLWGNSAYADPASLWYDVFFGMYEVDVPATQPAPFGYLSPAPDAPIDKRALVRLGLADWNYFSNHLYGVPIEAIRAIPVPADGRHVVVHPRVRLPSGDTFTAWDDVEITELTVVGPGRSVADHEDFDTQPHSEVGRAPWWVQPAWQRAFGVADRAPADVLPASFAPVKLQARLWMFHDEATVDGQRVYRTFFVGGTAPQGDGRAQDFLQAQLAALVPHVRDERLGFPLAPAPPHGGDAPQPGAGPEPLTGWRR